MLFVSHDRRFLENVATRIVSVRDGEVTVYNGGYRDFVSAARRASEPPPPPPPPKKREREPEPPKADGRVSFETQRQQARENEKRKRRIADLENSIALAEAELAVMREKLKQDPGGDWARVAELAEREQELSRRVDVMMSEWTKLSEASA